MPDEARPRNQPLLTEEELAERRHILLDGVEQFNSGYFFEAHETWEDLWYPSPWPARQFLQGVIQVAAALVHLVRHEYPGTVRLLDAALEKLEQFPEVYLGIDNARLIDDVRSARDGLAALGPGRFQEWDRRDVPQIRLVE
jgi:predicted metal-dependent hydrolase